MRVGFDVSPLARPHPPGLVRATTGLVEALEARARLEVVRLAPDPGQDLRRWRRRELPERARALDLVGVHSAVSALPGPGVGLRVQTVHELPWRHGVTENAGLRHRLWAWLGPHRADAVICPTEHVARDLRRALLSPRRIEVVPWGVGPPFAQEPPPGVVDEVVPGKWRLGEGRFALCLGAVRAKKGLSAVLRGLARLIERGGPELLVVVTGPDTPDLRRDLGLASRLGLSRWVSTPGTLPDEELPSLLRLATVVPVLSRSEGFGLPVLEALASGTPVLVPESGAQTEVAGPAGIRVDPDDPETVAEGLARAVREREERRAACVARAREFPWSRTAERVEALWERLTRGHPTGGGR